MQLIAEATDQFGVVQVYDDGQRRYLCFGSEDEQSCWNKSEPWRLQHDYTQAMCLFLLWGIPNRVLILGLGAGCLLQALLKINKRCHFEVVELRPVVVDYAYRYFALPQHKRIQLSVQAAQVYLSELKDTEKRGREFKKVSVVLADLYHGDGMDACFGDAGFWLQVQKTLKQDGVLVINYWQQEHLAKLDDVTVVNTLLDIFAWVYATKTVSGNWIIFATQQRLTLSQKACKQRAVELSKLLGFSLLPYLSRLQDLSG